MPSSTSNTVLVIGGGPAGCSAAHEAAMRGYDVVLAEAKDVVGGMAARNVIKDNVFEYGTHVFHTHFPELLERVKKVTGPELLEIERGSNLQIKFMGRYYVYPLQGLDLIRNLPPMLGIRAGLSFMKSVLLYDILHTGGKPANTEEYLIRTFGNVLYEVFFKDYSEKVWGLPLSQVDPDFGRQRIPRSDILSAVKQILDALGLSKMFKAHELSESVIGNIYYTPRGVGRIYERMAEEVVEKKGKVLTNARLKRVVLDAGAVKAAVLDTPEGDVEIEAAHIISTIPLPLLVDCLADSAPSQVIESGRKLTYRSIAITGMLVNKPQVRKPFMTYFKDHSFNRLSEPTNHGLKTTPDNCSMLLAETVCAYGDMAWSGDKAHQDQVVNDLEREGLIQRSEIIDMHHYTWRYAYPVYTLGFGEHLARIKDYVGSIGNLHSTGRQGNFNYVNMHIAMNMAIDTVTALEER